MERDDESMEKISNGVKHKVLIHKKRTYRVCQVSESFLSYKENNLKNFTEKKIKKSPVGE
jgi:hypothetical protein